MTGPVISHLIPQYPSDFQTKTLTLPPDKLEEIAEKIWYKESEKTKDKNLLTFWNEQEPFPSLGIGHFIWPPKGYESTFSFGRFHKVLAFMQKKGVSVPEWLRANRYCLWNTREEFYRDFESEKMQELREFLDQTKPFQAKYMLVRLNGFLSSILEGLKKGSYQDQWLADKFFQVAEAPNGMYILLDYLNFKHEGTNPQERYHGYGWGLLQVLENMDIKTFLNPQDAFIQAGKYVLQRRIDNAPDSEKEGLWQDNWFSRLDAYRL